MKKLKNGWFVPADDKRVTFLLENDAQMLNPTYESKYRDTILRHLPNKRLFVDVGANVGIWTLPMSSYFKKIIAYEPSLQNIECLTANIPKKVDIRKKAVADFSGSAEFRQAGKNCGDGKLCREGVRSTYKVPVVSLDNENLEQVDLVKIDTQGWELEVLKGMINILEKQKPWIMIEVNKNIDECCKILESKNYEVVYIKSKRNFVWAPLDGINSPTNKKIFQRYLGPGPYAERYGGK